MRRPKDDNPIYVAIDSMDIFEARRLADDLRGHIGGLKFGLTFWLRYHFSGIRHVAAGFDWFCDLKFNDIPEQVAGAVRVAVDYGPRLLTIHQDGGVEMMQAAVHAAQTEADLLQVRRPMILAVTRLTSQNARESDILGRAFQAHACGCDGVICSANEASSLRRELPDFLLTTPGIRPIGSVVGSHKRAATPRFALDAGVDYLVIGSPITQAADPRRMVQEIMQSMYDADAEGIAK